MIFHSWVQPITNCWAEAPSFTLPDWDGQFTETVAISRRENPVYHQLLLVHRVKGIPLFGVFLYRVRTVVRTNAPWWRSEENEVVWEKTAYVLNGPARSLPDMEGTIQRLMSRADALFEDVPSVPQKYRRIFTPREGLNEDGLRIGNKGFRYHFEN